MQYTWKKFCEYFSFFPREHMDTDLSLETSCQVRVDPYTLELREKKTAFSAIPVYYHENI